jgi:hypothetical protein
VSGAHGARVAPDHGRGSERSAHRRPRDRRRHPRPLRREEVHARLERTAQAMVPSWFRQRRCPPVRHVCRSELSRALNLSHYRAASSAVPVRATRATRDRRHGNSGTDHGARIASSIWVRGLAQRVGFEPRWSASRRALSMAVVKSSTSAMERAGPSRRGDLHTDVRGKAHGRRGDGNQLSLNWSCELWRRCICSETIVKRPHSTHPETLDENLILCTQRTYSHPRRPNGPREFPNKTAKTRNHRRVFGPLWTTLSGFESLPPSQTATAYNSAT